MTRDDFQVRRSAADDFQVRAIHYAYGDGADPVAGEALALTSIAINLGIIADLMFDRAERPDIPPNAFQENGALRVEVLR